MGSLRKPRNGFASLRVSEILQRNVPRRNSKVISMFALFVLFGHCDAAITWAFLGITMGLFLLYHFVYLERVKVRLQHISDLDHPRH
jgi:hypothetical protein